MTRALRLSIYREHLEELSFLHEHRRSALEDPEYTQQDIAGIEARMEAHLDGLVLGGELAVRVCLAQAANGDAGELYGALRTFCRLDHPDAMLELAARVDAEAPGRVDAAVDALLHDWPAAWDARVGGWLAAPGTGSTLRAGLASLAGRRGLPVGTALCAAAQTLRGPALMPVIEALGRVREPAAAMILFRQLQQPDAALARAAAVAALRLELPQAVDLLARAAATLPWATVPLALADAGRHRALLLARARAAPSPDTLLAEGLVGDPSCLADLRALLPDPEHGRNAALAAYLVTGAELWDLPDGGPPAAHEEDGPLAAGVAVAEDRWAAWVAEHEGALRRGERLRLGRPASPRAALACLIDRRLPPAVRRLIADELAIATRAPISFAPEALTGDLERRVAEIGKLLPP